MIITKRSGAISYRCLITFACLISPLKSRRPTISTHIYRRYIRYVLKYSRNNKCSRPTINNPSFNLGHFFNVNFGKILKTRYLSLPSVLAEFASDENNEWFIFDAASKRLGHLANPPEALDASGSPGPDSRANESQLIALGSPARQLVARASVRSGTCQLMTKKACH